MYKYLTKLLLLLSDEMLLNGHLERITKNMFKLYVLIWPQIPLLYGSRRILHRIFPVKNHLMNIKAIDNDDCTSCGNSIVTIEYIFITFISCSHSLAMWNQISTHIYNNTSEKIGFSISNVILKDCPTLDTHMVVNFLTLYGYSIFFSVPNKTKFHINLVYYGT